MQKVLGCFQEWLENSEEPMEDITGEREAKMNDKERKKNGTGKIENVVYVGKKIIIKELESVG